MALHHDKNPKARISYPDFVWDDGLYVTETQKAIARVHRIPDVLLRSLWVDLNADAGTGQPATAPQSGPE